MSAKYKPSDYEVLRRRCVELKESGWNRNAEAAEGHRLSLWVDRGLGKPDAEEVPGVGF